MNKFCIVLDGDIDHVCNIDYFLQACSLWLWEIYPTCLEMDQNGLCWMGTLTLCGLSLWTLSWMTTRCWHWLVMKEFLWRHQWDCYLKLVTWKQPHQQLYPELVSSSSIHRILDGIRKWFIIDDLVFFSCYMSIPIDQVYLVTNYQINSCYEHCVCYIHDCQYSNN